jgi:hypothetical protein
LAQVLALPWRLALPAFAPAPEASLRPRLLLQVLRNGDLLDVHHIGRHCSPDDELAISMAEEVEARWQQQRRQQQAAQKVAQQQAQQERAQEPGGGRGLSGGGALALADGGGAAWSHGPRTATPPAASFGPDPEPSHRGPLLQHHHHQHQHYQSAQQQQQQHQQPDQEHDHTHWQQEAEEQEGPPPAGPIQGLTQRMLAHLYRAATAKAGSEPAAARAELQALYRNFDTFQQLAVWKLQLLDAQHLLLNLGPPLAPGEQQAAQQAASQQCQFFLVFNLHTTRVLALYRSSSEALLRLFLRHHALFQLDSATPLWDQFAPSAVHSPQVSRGGEPRLPGCAPRLRA